RPSARPAGSAGWPLWNHRVCLNHNRLFGWACIAGLARGAIVPAFRPYRLDRVADPSMTSPARIVLLPGDGIGPEVTDAARRVLDAAAAPAGLQLDYVTDLVGGASVDAHGVALRPQTLRLCKTADAILFGAVGGPRWDDAAPQSAVRPGSALLGLRKGLELFANLRPVRVDPAMVATSALRPERVRDVDLLVVRELTGGLYFSRPKRRYTTPRGEAAVDTMRYSTPEIERVAVRAFELSRMRRRRV